MTIPPIKASDIVTWAKVTAIPVYPTDDLGVVHYVLEQVDKSSWAVTGDAIEISRAITYKGEVAAGKDIRNWSPWYPVGRYVRITKKFIPEIVAQKTAVVYTHATKNFNATGIGSGVEVGDMAWISGTNITGSQYCVTEVTDASNIIFGGVVSTDDNIDSIVNIGNGQYWHIDEDMFYCGDETESSIRFSEEDLITQAVWA